MLKQTFGQDFKFPNFDDEEKFRRKIENCLNFFINYQPKDKTRKEYFGTELEKAGEEISNKIRVLNFSGAYQDFKSLTYKKISSLIIPSIQNKGISRTHLKKITSKFANISRIFAPITIKKITGTPTPRIELGLYP